MFTRFLLFIAKEKIDELALQLVNAIEKKRIESEDEVDESESESESESEPEPEKNGMLIEKFKWSDG